MKVLLRAPLLTNSGYGVHSRQVFDWLYNRKDIELTVECLRWGNTPWMLNQDSENGLIRKVMQKSLPLEGDYDVSFQIVLPDEWDPGLAKKNVGITALVETDRCSEKWVAAANKMDHVVVPSSFTESVLKKSGLVTTKTSVIPEWFNDSLLNRSLLAKTQNDERFSKIDKPFNILLVGALTSLNDEDDRKNIKNTIKWVCEEFSGHDDVGVLIKTTMGRNTSLDKKMCAKRLKSFITSLGEESPKVYLVHGNMEKNEIASLIDHEKVKMFVSATRGEGYGLPLIEAAAAGKPIVATNWSGHLEFLQEENFKKVDYDLIPISETKVDNRIFFKGFKWAEPIEKSFKSQIRSVYNDYETAKQNAKSMKKHIHYNFNSSAIKKQYDELLSKVMEK
jgi:glycosyltransferase involved in cell wall biosynthesis